VSQVNADGGLPGLVAAQGDIGAIQRDAGGKAVLDASGHLARFGGVFVNGKITGQIAALGNLFGDLQSNGLAGGRVAVKGRAVAGLDPSRMGILGNVTINGGVDSSAAIVSGGVIGDAVGGTVLNTGNIQGIVGAKGAINLAPGVKTSGALFFGQNLTTTDPASAAAIDKIFTPGAFDVTDSDLQGLNMILRHLAGLTVSGGHLTV